jgi:hypothetical protein
MTLVSLKQRRLTPHEQRIWEVFVKANDWITRNAVRDTLGRTSLNPHDTGIIEMFVDNEMLEKRSVPAGITKRYEYRVRA